MAHVYILRGCKGRCYIGSTINLDRRMRQHQNGLTPSSKRLGLPLVLVISLEVATLKEARDLERQLKSFKQSALALNVLEDLKGAAPI